MVDVTFASGSQGPGFDTVRYVEQMRGMVFKAYKSPQYFIEPKQ